MAAAKVGPSIDKAINLALKSYGFKKKRSSAWCKETDKLCYMIFRRGVTKPYADYITRVPSFSFVITFCLYFKFIPNPSADHRAFYTFEEGECRFRISLAPSNQPVEVAKMRNKSLWYVRPDESNLPEVIEDVLEKIENVGLPFFETYSDLENVFSAMYNKGDNDGDIFGWGNCGSPLYNLNLGYISRELGRKKLALQLFKKVMNEVNEPYFPRLVQQAGSMNVPSTFIKSDYEKLKAELEP